jgi:bacterioferritin-associated ferredoxin
MDDKRKDRKRFNPGQKSSVRDSSKEKKGFAGLDPAKVGLEGPGWLSTSLPLTDTSTEPSLPPQSAIHSPASTQWSESNILPAMSPEPRTLLEGMKVVCICKGIKKSVFWKVLDTGVRTKEEINCLTGSGSGSCQGRRCGPRIMELLRDLST